MSKIYHLNNWSVISNADPYTPPEYECKKLSGIREEDNKEVITSTIMSADGNKIITYSGSVYILGEIDPGFLTWMKENNISFDPANPIKIRK